MAKKVTEVSNKQGLKIILMPGVVQHSLFEQTHCDLCGMPTTIEDDIYYEAIIDQFFCEECHNLYLMTAERYKSDIKEEEENFNKAKLKLEGANWWNKELF